MLEFTLKSDRDKFVEKIKEEGLFSVLAENMNAETRELFSDVWDELCSRFSEEDFIRLEEGVCDNITYIEEN